MSEYQYVEFQAVDRPLNHKQLEFAERQSSRAEVSRRSLTVEYHYSSFRGDVDGLLPKVLTVRQPVFRRTRCWKTGCSR